MKTIPCIMLLAFCILSPHQVWADRALLIGVGDYKLDSVGDLPGIDNDIDTMRDLLLRIGLRSSDIKILIDEQATGNNVIAAIRDWLMTNPGERTFLYFSGHGARYRDQQGDEADYYDETLCLYDWGETKPEGEMPGALTDDFFNWLLSNIPSQETYMIIDSCHSGTMNKSVFQEFNYIPRFIEPLDDDDSIDLTPILESKGLGLLSSKDAPIDRSGKMYALLAACQEDEAAVGNREGGYFTRGFVQAVENAFQQNYEYASLEQMVKDSHAYIVENISNPDMHHIPGLIGHPDLMERGLRLKSRSNNSAWQQLESIADNGSDPITLEANQARFRLGEELIVSLKTPRSGYLYIFNMTANDENFVLLFPNQYSANNKVTKGSQVRIPPPSNEFALPATPPTGKSMIVAVITNEPLGEVEQTRSITDSIFAMISEENLTKSFAVTQRQRTGYSSGKILVDIIE